MIVSCVSVSYYTYSMLVYAYNIVQKSETNVYLIASQNAY